MVGSKIGGVNVFGGGLALYATGKVIVGGVGVSGDTSCTDHDVAWRLRHKSGYGSPSRGRRSFGRRGRLDPGSVRRSGISRSSCGCSTSAVPGRRATFF